MIFDRAVRRVTNSASEVLTLDNPKGWTVGGPLLGELTQTAAMKLSAVNACVEVKSNSMSKLPIYVMDAKSKQRLTDHPLMRLLEMRPNEAMTPSVYKKLQETNRLLRGNAYGLITRSRATGRPQELIPLPPDYTTPVIDDQGRLWYCFVHPRTGEVRKLDPFDVLHYKAYSEDGITGISVLARAKSTLEAARAAQEYERKYYTHRATPDGVLKVASQLEPEAKDKIREEWQRAHSGVDNAFRVAVLDLGLEYQPIGVSNKDSQFVESKAVSVEDIARFFGVPLYKINAGKQSYSSNEQNDIEYVKGSLQPDVTQYEEEDTYKLLFEVELRQGLEIRRNMMAELRGDTTARGAWYKTMREVGAFSVNDILALEDMPEVPGGDGRYASLNYVPLEDFRHLSTARNT